jgi:ATP-dependent exoDNAse (exonuclease V) alpha subunit
MVDSKDFLSILETAKSGKNNRVMFGGDIKQFQAVGAGKMFKELQNIKGKANIITMNEILRQKTPEMISLVKQIKRIKEYQEVVGYNPSREAVKKTKEMVGEAFQLMTAAGYIEELKSKSKDEEITKMMIQDKAMDEFLSSTDALMFTATRKERDELNIRVREKKYSDIELAAGKKILVRENNGESRLATNYRVNDIIIPKGQQKEYRVKEIMANRNRLILGSGDETIEMNLSQEKVHRSYREKEREIIIGEAVMFTNNDGRIGKDDGLKGGVKNGMKGTVEKLDKDGNMEVGSVNYFLGSVNYFL